MMWFPDLTPFSKTVQMCSTNFMSAQPIQPNDQLPLVAAQTQNTKSIFINPQIFDPEDSVTQH